MLSPLGDQILQEFNTLFLTEFRAYKFARPPKKNVGEEGPQTDKNLPQSPFTGQFLDDDILLWCLYS